MSEALSFDDLIITDRQILNKAVRKPLETEARHSIYGGASLTTTNSSR